MFWTLAAKGLAKLEVGTLTGATHGEKSPLGLAQRDGDRERDWETRAVSVELRIPKLSNCSYFPGFLERRTGPALRVLQSLPDMRLPVWQLLPGGYRPQIVMHFAKHIAGIPRISPANQRITA